MGYSQRAIDKCANLYARRVPHDQIEKEMKTEWPTWSRKNLYGENGWIERYGFEDARERYLRRMGQFREAAETTANEMLGELIQMRKNLWKKISQDGADSPDPQRAYAYLKISGAIRQLLRDDAGGVDDAFSLEDSQLFQVLNQIPEIRKAIDTHKNEILEKIEQAGA